MLLDIVSGIERFWEIASLRGMSTTSVSAVSWHIHGEISKLNAFIEELSYFDGLWLVHALVYESVSLERGVVRGLGIDWSLVSVRVLIPLLLSGWRVLNRT